MSCFQRLMRSTSVGAIFILMTAPPSLAQDASQWIVIGTDASQSVTNTLRTLDNGTGRMSSGLAPLRTEGGRTVAAMDPVLNGLMQRVIHTAHHRCGGYTVHPSREAAEAEVVNPFYQPGAVDRMNAVQRTIDQQLVVRPLLDKVDKTHIVSTIEALQNLGTRHYQSEGGEKAARQVESLWKSYGKDRADFSVSPHVHSWRQNSVVATLKGTDLSEEIVVIGGHLDSINMSHPSAPGADDDASGVAAVSEVLRVLLANDFRPRRTLKFIAYAAEEVGLLGSDDIAKAHRDAAQRVVGAMQLDMTGFAGSESDMYFVSDYVSADLTAYLKDLIAEYNGSGSHAITYGDTSCGYACSDHGSWTRYGVPSAFPFEAKFEDYNQKIHSDADLLEHIDSTGEKQAKFSKLGVEFMVEMGKQTVD